MRNLKFGAFFLGLVVVIGGLVAGVSAQSDGRPATREHRPSVDVFSMRTGGAQLGVRISDVDAKAASPGVKIDDVNAESPAAKAGLKAGDIIVEYDGEKVRSARQFTRLVQETAEGRSVSIALMRDGKRQTVNATPEEGRMARMPDFNFDFRDLPRTFEYRMPERAMPFMQPSRGRLGVTVQPMSHDLEDYFGAKNGGALVSSVTPDSTASKAGLKAGDVITAINGHSVRDADDLMREVSDANGDVTITLMRDKKEMTLKAQLDKPKGLSPQDH